MNALWPIVMQCLRKSRRVAIVDDTRSYTFAQVLGGAFHVAAKIDGTTAKPHVGVMLPTSGAFAVALLGGWIAKRTVVSLNYLLSKDELAFVIRDSAVDTILTSRKLIEVMGGEAAVLAGNSGLRLVYLDDIDFTGTPPLRWPPVPRSDEVAVILYTSGTIARPKGVMLTHGNFAANLDATIAHARITQADTFAGVLPQFHSFGLTVLTLIPLRAGAKVVYTARFVPRRLINLIREHHADIVVAIPSMWGALLGVKDAGPADFKSVRLAISGGEPLPRAVFEEFQRRFGVHLLEGYGLTETSPVTHWSTPDRYRDHAVGTALPGVKVVIIDEQDRVLPVGAEGEILIAGANVMTGYYKLPELTGAAFVEVDDGGELRDGASLDRGSRGVGGATRYFRTGDIGKLDAEGYLYITGRKKEMLKVAGEIVVPREIEEVLAAHPAVKAVAVIGKRDEMRGEVPVAFVELREGEQFDEAALRTWCRERLAGYKVPREIRLTATLPRNPTGKIVKRELKTE